MDNEVELATCKSKVLELIKEITISLGFSPTILEAENLLKIDENDLGDCLLAFYELIAEFNYLEDLKGVIKAKEEAITQYGYLTFDDVYTVDRRMAIAFPKLLALYELLSPIYSMESFQGNLAFIQLVSETLASKIKSLSIDYKCLKFHAKEGCSEFLLFSAFRDKKKVKQFVKNINYELERHVHYNAEDLLNGLCKFPYARLIDLAHKYYNAIVKLTKSNENKDFQRLIGELDVLMQWYWEQGTPASISDDDDYDDDDDDLELGYDRYGNWQGYGHDYDQYGNWHGYGLEEDD